MRAALLVLALIAASCAPGRAPEEPAAAPEFRPDPRIVITGGVHGNEPSGALVLPELERMGFTVFGPCNPWGLENNNRNLRDGRDLNRLFARDDVPEVRAVKEFLRLHPPALLLDLHEDPGGTGAYLIQHGPDDDIGRRIIEELKDEFEFDPSPSFLMVKGKDGLLLPGARELGLLNFTGTYGLAFYAWATYGCTTIVTECPGSWPMEKKERYQLRVVETAARIFAERAANYTE
jgi:hypothetical protein